MTLFDLAERIDTALASNTTHNPQTVSDARALLAGMVADIKGDNSDEARTIAASALAAAEFIDGAKGEGLRRIYVAGPMTGVPEFNYPAFHQAAQQLRAAGYHVENPAENYGGDTTRPYADYMRAAIQQVLSCDEIALLPGWENSRGARIEVSIAEALGMPATVLGDSNGL